MLTSALGSFDQAERPSATVKQSAAVEDQRPLAVAQRRLQGLMLNSPQAEHLRTLQRKLNAPRKVAQAKIGDVGTPHEAPGGSDGITHVILPQVDEAVIVPGLAFCAAMRINIYQQAAEGERLVASAVLHSEGWLAVPWRRRRN